MTFILHDRRYSYCNDGQGPCIQESVEEFFGNKKSDQNCDGENVDCNTDLLGVRHSQEAGAVHQCRRCRDQREPLFRCR